MARMGAWREPLLMLVTDRTSTGGRPLVDVVAAAVAGGVNAVQLREKGMPAGDLVQLARQLRGVCGPEALLLINDRADVAMLTGADGVHLGERGLPAAALRQCLPARLRIGRSVHSANAARQAEQDGVDYLVAGTIYPSVSHPEGEAGGVERLTGIITRTSLPVLAIGGVTPERAAECRRAGAAGVAVVSGILSAADPCAAAAEYAAVLASITEEA